MDGWRGEAAAAESRSPSRYGCRRLGAWLKPFGGEKSVEFRRLSQGACNGFEQ
jgi:hypothetical protein